MSRARAAQRPELGDLVATAKARFTGIPARKARYVADLIRGLTVAQAERQLGHIHRPSAVPIVSKVLKSAVANAQDKEEAGEPAELLVGEIMVDGGPTARRFQARAMGRACTIRKRTSHVTIKLYTQLSD